MSGMQVDIYIPTYGRADKLPGVLANIESSTKYPHRVIFILELDDIHSIRRVKELGLVPVINRRSHTYAGSINSAWETLHSDAFFCGADDLDFKPGWLEKAVEAVETNKRVIGTQDLHNQEVIAGQHATHYLVVGSYIEDGLGTIDGSYPVEFEYHHNWTDREFIGTAKFRGEFKMCGESVVEHLHFTFGLSQMDATYEKSRRHISEDQALYESRRDKWGRL